MVSITSEYGLYLYTGKVDMRKGIDVITPSVMEKVYENSRSKRENSRSKKIDGIVGFCSEPKSLDEIATFLGVKDRNFMKRMYIDPILGTRIRMTEPNSPNSPKQKHVRIF